MKDIYKIIIATVLSFGIAMWIAWIIYPETITKTVNDNCPQPKGYSNNDPSTIACLKRGGVPIYSAWNGALKECK